MNLASNTSCHCGREGAEWIIRLNHRLLVESAETLYTLRATALAPLRQTPCGSEAWTGLRLDLTAARDLNSFGLALLFDILKPVTMRGCRCHLILGSETVMRVVRFTRLTSIASVSMVPPDMERPRIAGPKSGDRFHRPALKSQAGLCSLVLALLLQSNA